MSLETKISNDLKTAMKAKDAARLRAIRAIKAAILVRKTDGSGDAIDEQEEIKILQKLVKSRKESLGIYEKQNREDLAKIEREEIEVLKTYLPVQMSEMELRKMLSSIIENENAIGMKDMGRVMGKANQQLAGRADGKMIAQIVKDILSQSI